MEGYIFPHVPGGAGVPKKKGKGMLDRAGDGG